MEWIRTKSKDLIMWENIDVLINNAGVNLIDLVGELQRYGQSADVTKCQRYLHDDQGMLLQVQLEEKERS